MVGRLARLEIIPSGAGLNGGAFRNRDSRAMPVILDSPFRIGKYHTITGIDCPSYIND